MIHHITFFEKKKPPRPTGQGRLRRQRDERGAYSPRRLPAGGPEDLLLQVDVAHDLEAVRATGEGAHPPVPGFHELRAYRPPLGGGAAAGHPIRLIVIDVDDDGLVPGGSDQRGRRAVAIGGLDGREAQEGEEGEEQTQDRRHGGLHILDGSCSALEWRTAKSTSESGGRINEEDSFVKSLLGKILLQIFLKSLYRQL